MKKCFSVCIVLALFFLSGLFFPRDVGALKPNIDLTISSNSVKPGDTVVFNITIESNYRLKNDSVEVRWGDGSHPNFPCIMLADYATPPQECSFSAQYIYSNEKDYFAQVSACSDETSSECDLVLTTIHVVAGTTATSASSTIPDQYDNPLSAENIPQLIWQIVEYFFKILVYYLVPLLIIIGAYVIVTSGGSASKVNRGKKIIIWTLVGFVLILLANGLFALIQKLLGK